MKDTFTCMIVDDEPKSVAQLEDMIHDLFSDMIIIGTYNHWKPAYEALRNAPADIVFLDIAMPQKSGIALLNLLPDLKSEVIFVTADPDHALDAFNLSASGYMLKPLEDTMLLKCVNKVVERIRNKHLAAQNILQASITAVRPKIGIPNTSGMQFIDMADILYLQGTARYTRLMIGAKEMLSSYSIGKFKDLLKTGSFLQVHRSFIINLNYVNKYNNNGTIVMNDGMEIPLARDAREQLLKVFNKITH